MCVACARTWQDIDELLDELDQSQGLKDEPRLSAPPIGIPAIAEEVVKSHSGILQLDSFVDVPLGQMYFSIRANRLAIKQALRSGPSCTLSRAPKFIVHGS